MPFFSQLRYLAFWADDAAYLLIPKIMRCVSADLRDLKCKRITELDSRAGTAFLSRRLVNVGVQIHPQPLADAVRSAASAQRTMLRLLTVSQRSIP